MPTNPSDFELQLGDIVKGAEYDVILAAHQAAVDEVEERGFQRCLMEFDSTEGVKEAVRAARIDELRSLPWKLAPRYGVNSPYVTKEWLRERLAELEGK